MRGKTLDNVSVAPVSLADVRQLSRVVSFSSARDPVQAVLFSLPPEGTLGHDKAVARTIGVQSAFLRRIICNPNIHIAATYVDRTMAGFSVWTSPENESFSKRFVPCRLRLLGMLYTIYDKVLSLVYPASLQRILDPATAEYLRRRSLMMQMDDQAMEAAIPADISARGYWTMSGMGVLKEYERHGIGSKLLRWGCKQADKTDRAVVAAASPDGAKLYSRWGFELVRKETLLREETEGGVTLSYMIRFPASLRKKE